MSSIPPDTYPLSASATLTGLYSGENVTDSTASSPQRGGGPDDSPQDPAYVPEGIHNTVIHIYDTRNETNRYFYQLKGDYQVTYIFCSGVGPDDFINVTTLSADQGFHSMESALEHNRAFRTTRLHYHDYFEFMIVLEGAVTARIEGKDFRYPAGSACLINRGLRHSEGYEGMARLLFIGLSPVLMEELLQYCRSSSLDIERSIPDTLLFRFLQESLETDQKNSCLDFIPAQNTLRDKNNRLMHDLTETMFRSLLMPSFGATFRVKALLCDFLALLASPEAFSCTALALEDAGNDYLLFTRITHLMDEQDGRLTRGQLEKLLNYSGDYLNRIVKKYSGKSLFDYGMTFCMRSAEYYLEHTQKPVSEIAILCGFTNKTHFYRQFEKHFGVTPMEWRRKALQTG